jgi:hypothetical protein
MQLQATLFLGLAAALLAATPADAASCPRGTLTGQVTPVAGALIRLPRGKQYHPDRDRLATRFEMFQRAA